MSQEPVPVEVFVGVDVGKSAHHAVALDAQGRVLLDRALPQDEAKLRALVRELRRHGSVLFVVDQPATIGALPLAVARDEGVLVGYLPGLAMRRIAEIHAGEAKTDARDAAVIAHAARTLPHALRPLRQDDDATARLAMLAGFDGDLAAQVNQLSNRIRGLLTQIHPALERVLGPRLQHPAALELLQRYPSPSALRAAGRARIAARLRRRAPRLADRLTDDVVAALAEQTVVVTGTDAAALVLPQLAEQLALGLSQRQRVAEQLQELVEEHDLLAAADDARRRVPDRSSIAVETAGRIFRTPGAPGCLRRLGSGHPPIRHVDPR